MQEPQVEEVKAEDIAKGPTTFEGRYYAENGMVIFEIKPHIKLSMTGDSAEQMYRELKKAIKKARLA